MNKLNKKENKKKKENDFEDDFKQNLSTIYYDLSIIRRRKALTKYNGRPLSRSKIRKKKQNYGHEFNVPKSKQQEEEKRILRN